MVLCYDIMYDIPPHPYLQRMLSGQGGCSMCGFNVVLCWDFMCNIPPHPYLPRTLSDPYGYSMCGPNVVLCCDIMCDISSPSIPAEDVKWSL